jgi:DNA end-binding protein Ku
MTARAVWKGTINFGLVSIGIELYSAIQPHVLGFKLLHNVCHTPISNKRWCEHCNREVAWEETVKGLKLKDGTYFILTQENIKKLKPEKTDTIDVVEFVETAAVSPLYYDQHYYVAPHKKSDKAFFLLAAALDRAKQAAIGRFVMRDKEYVCLLQPYKNALLLSTLNYEYEIKHIEQIDELKLPAKINEQELKLAELLMHKLYKKKFDISEFKDTFATRLAQAIKLKEKGKIIELPEKKPAVAPEASLMDALKESLSQYEKAERPVERRRAR